MKRRDLLRSLAGVTAASFLSLPDSASSQSLKKRTTMGIVTYCLSLRQRASRAIENGSNLADPIGMLDYCHTLGTGGIQISLTTKDDAYLTRLRRKAEDYNMYIEGIASLPKQTSDVDRFAAELRTAQRAGVSVVRVTLVPGRRYERFDSADEYRDFAARGLKMLQLAEPVAKRYGVRLAVENHKAHRIPERLTLFRQISSESVGACIDTGNSFALLEDPIEVVKAYAPWACAVHLKDQAIQEYEDGFLLADIPLGDGFLDLKQMVQVLRQANTQIHFSLELITRDPLKVPCLTDKYWTTFPDVNGRDLARTLRTVRTNACKQLPAVSSLSPEDQLQRETDNVATSITYAREVLGI